MDRCKNPPKRMLGFKIVYPKEMPDKRVGGMNCRAAHDPYWNFPYTYPCSTILIDSNQSCKVIRETIRHEAIEIKLMQKAKLGYRKAHEITTEIEKKLK